MKKPVKFDELLLIGMAVICFLTAIADFVGILHSVEFLSERISGMVLLFLSAMAAYTIGEKRGKLNDIEMLTQSKADDILKEISDNHTSISNLIKGENISRLFKEEAEMYEYLLDRYSQVKKSIDITHFGTRLFDDENDNTVNSRFCKALGKIMRQEEIRVRRVYLVRNDDQFTLVQKIFNDHKNDPKVSIGCYSGKSLNVYLISLMIVDDEEVLVTYAEKSIRDFRRTLSIKNSTVVEFYRDYFNYLLQESYTIKDGKDIYEAEFDKLRNEIQSEAAKYN